jgi:hypothetical protein
VTKNCHIIRCIESDSFYGYVGIRRSWDDNISEEEQWAEINIERTVSKNHRTTAEQVTSELNIHFEDPLSTKTVQRDVSFTNPTFTVGL